MVILKLGDEMKTRENKYTHKKREKCGDCYYNGYCNIHLNKCKYLKKARTES